MEKTHGLRPTLSFSIHATGDRSYVLDTSKMSDSAVEAGLVRAAKQICGDAIGSKKMALDKKIAVCLKKIARLQSGTLGEGVFGARVTRLEKMLRTILVTKLENEGTKTAKAQKLAAAQPVKMVYFAIYKKDGLSEEEAAKRWAKVEAGARMMVQIASDGDDIDADEEVDDTDDTDESEEEENAA